MFGDSAQKVKRSLCLGMMLILGSLAISELLIGCGGGVSWIGPNDSAVTPFGYTSSPLLAIFVPPSKSLSDAYFGMTIHQLAANPATAAVPFPAFPIHTFRLWDVVNWRMLEPADGQ